MSTVIRGLVVVMGLLLAAPAPELEAQQPKKISKVGVVWPTAAGPNPLLDAFEQALQGLGWRKNDNLRIEERYAARQEALAPLAAELVTLGVDVLVAWSPAGAIAAKQVAGQTPVVFLAAGDPIGFGLVSSLAHPGGNVTGVSFEADVETYAKGLQLLKEAVPSLTRVALLTAMDPRTTLGRQTMAAAAKTLSLELFEVEVSTPRDLETAVRRAKDRGAQALYIWPSGLMFTSGPRLADLALAARLPSIHPFREGATAGGLLSYAPSLTDIARRGAIYVDRILRGTRPGELPVEQPTKLEFVINLKTAKTLGLTIPPSLLLRADQVIE